MLRWPSRSLASLRLLFSPLQDIDTYVEDVDDEAFYRQLFRIATQGEIKIQRVFSLGSKSAVIKAAEKHDHSTRRALFIVDGDLNFVRGEDSPSTIGLHQHQAYCVENLLVSELAIATLLSEEKGWLVDKAVSAFEFSRWRSELTTCLVKLFCVYAYVNEIDSTIRTVGRNIHSMCKCVRKSSPAIHELDPAKVEEVCRELLGLIHSPSDNSRQDVIGIRIEQLSDPLLAVSGKDVVLPLIQLRLSSFGANVSPQSLRMRLVAAGEPERFERLGAALRAAATGQHAF